MKKIVVLILLLSLSLNLFSCTENEIPTIEYSHSIRLFAGAMGRSTIIGDEETVRKITDAVNDMGKTPKGKENVDGYTFELTWLDEDGRGIVSIRIYEVDEIGYGGTIYETDCTRLLDILSAVPMPL